MSSVDPYLMKRRLAEAVPIESDLLEEVEATLKQSLTKLACSPAQVASIVIAWCHKVFTRVEQYDTFAVQLAGDGLPLLTVNPDFIKRIGPDQAVVALVHEAEHLKLRHLYTDPDLWEDPLFVLACEVMINYRIVNLYRMPLIRDLVTGEVIIVDPEKVFESYRAALKRIGATPASRDVFFTSDIECLRELRRMPKPPKAKGVGTCVHASEGEDPEGSGGAAPLDPEEVKRFMDKVISEAITAAKAGNRAAFDELNAWMDSSPEARKVWGDLGAGSLRGETMQVKAPSQWQRWTADAIGTRLEDAHRWRYNKKLSAIDPRVSPRGQQPRRHGSVFIDASGSMHQSLLDEIAQIVGEVDELDIDWHTFDGDVWPFRTGEAFRGGGGTSFQVIDDHVSEGGDGGDDECEAEPDFVLVITDGYAPKIQPRDADSWIWLIVPGGDAWPAEAGMSCWQLDEGELLAG